MVSTLLTGIEAYYKLDGDALDATGNGNNGTINGATVTTSGKINDAYSFDGVNDYIDTNTGITSLANFTFSLWFYPNALANDYLIGFSGGTTELIYIQVRHDGSDFIRLGLRDGGVDIVNTFVTPISNNIWHMITGTYDGSNLRIYHNGSLVSTVATTLQPSSLTLNQIGVLNNSLYTHGVIDEVGIWSRALTASEISELYNSGAGLQYPFTSTTTVKKNALLLGSGL